MKRSWLLMLLLAACSAPPECELRNPRTGRPALEGEVAGFADGGLFASASVDCNDGWCVRDATVVSRGADQVAFGYCAATCDPLGSSTCAESERCVALLDVSAGICARR